MLSGVNVSGEGEPGDILDRCGHGTLVCATIHAVAPHAPLVPVRALAASGVLRDPRALEEALAWVWCHRDSLGIGVVCMAVGDASHQVHDEAHRGAPLERLVADLRGAGVPTVVSAGSRGPGLRDRSQGMAWPAVLREVVSVGSAELGPDGKLRLSSRTRRLHPSLGRGCATTVFAVPGPPGGTSGAAAVVAGSLAALGASSGSLTVDELLVELLEQAQVLTDGEGLEWWCLGSRAP